MAQAALTVGLVSRMTRLGASRLILPALAALFWLVAVGVGFAALMKYQKHESGATGAPREHWPANAAVALDRTHDLLW